MLDVVTLALVTEQVEKLRELASAANVSELVQQGHDVFITFMRRREGRTYVLRFRCDNFPIAVPSAHFVDPATLEDSGPEVWPSDGEQAVKRNANPRFICLPGVREYYEHGHGPVPQERPDLSVIFHHIAQALEARG